MKLLKVPFISIISILLLQSQLNGKNLECIFNPISTTCSDTLKDVTDTKNVNDVCELSESIRPINKLSMYDAKEVSISHSHPSFMIKHWKKHGKKIPEPPSDIILQVANGINYVKNNDETDEYERGEDSYFFILVNKIRGIVTLYFDRSSKKSILTFYYASLSREKKEINWSETYFGKCMQFGS